MSPGLGFVVTMFNSPILTVLFALSYKNNNVLTIPRLLLRLQLSSYIIIPVNSKRVFMKQSMAVTD